MRDHPGPARAALGKALALEMPPTSTWVFDAETGEKVLG
jgi:hypothetical protein